MQRTQARRGFIIGVMLWALIAVVTVVESLNDAAVRPGWFMSARVTVLRVWPQGWAFFTRSPLSADYGAYQIEPDGRLHDALLGPYARPENLFGVSRRARAQGPELALLVNKIPDAAWQECHGSGYSAAECGASTTTPVVLTNNSLVPSLCGPAFLLTKDEPVPWAWQQLTHHQRKTHQMAAVTITCPTR